MLTFASTIQLLSAGRKGKRREGEGKEGRLPCIDPLDLF
jgi:hypothetical protein